MIRTPAASSQQGLRATSPRGLKPLPCITQSHASRAARLSCRARKDDQVSSGLTAAVNTLQSAVNSVAELVPETVPRPAAKGGVAIVGGLLLFGLLKQLVSGIFTLVLIGGVGYWWLTKDSGDSDDDFKPKKRSKDEDLSDPLAETRRIMDKYK